MTISFLGFISRTYLGIGVLDLNDGVKYTMTNRIMGGSVNYERNQVSSPWVDGDVTVSRRRGNVTDSIGFNVYGSSHDDLRTNLENLVEAFSQDSFTMTLTMNGANYQYQCEAADYSMDWDRKLHSTMATITFQVPRKPIPYQGI